MHPATLKSFGLELEKHALSAPLLARYAAKRAKQGVTGAAGLVKGLAKAPPGVTSRAISPRVRQNLKYVGERAQLQRRAKTLPTRMGVQPQATATRARVNTAIKREAAGAKTRTNVPLSKGYEGYMTDAQTQYTPKHMANVMGIKPSQVKLRSGPTEYQRQLGTSGTLPGAGAPAAGRAGGGGVQRHSPPNTPSGTPVRGGVTGATKATAVSRPPRRVNTQMGTERTIAVRGAGTRAYAHPRARTPLATAPTQIRRVA